MARFKKAFVALAGVGLVATGYAWLGNQPAAVAQTEGDVVIATVNGENIYRGAFEEAYAQLQPQAQQMGMATIYPLLLERMVDEKLIGVAASKAIPDDDPVNEYCGFRGCRPTSLQPPQITNVVSASIRGKLT